jgi:SAM-dependent methyltransferase
MDKIQVKDSGPETLDVISEADNFNRWMYQTIKPHCSGNILEVGSGIGNISQFFLADNQEISLSDLSTDYFRILENKFSSYPNLKSLFTLDFAEKELETKYPQLIGKFDTVFALNVLEHVPDHEQSIRNCYKLLKPGGKLVILVPAFQSLFNQFDVALEHQRRYTPQTLKKVMSIPGFRLVCFRQGNEQECHSRGANAFVRSACTALENSGLDLKTILWIISNLRSTKRVICF